MHRGASHPEPGWHLLHPGPKVLTSALLVLSALALPHPAGLLVTGVSLAALVGPARVPLRTLARALWAPLLFVGLSAVISAPQLTVKGGGVQLSGYAIDQVLALLTRSLGALSALMLLTLTTSPSDCLRFFTRLGVPGALAEVGLGVLRLIGLVGVERDRLIRAASLRGADASGAAQRRTAVAVAVALFGRTYRRGARLEQALALRSPGGLLATMPAHGPWRWRDVCGGLTLATLPVAVWSLLL